MGDPALTVSQATETDRDLIDVWGPDAEAYLQGQLSQDIEALEPGGSALSFVLSPTGKVDSWFRIHRIADDSFVLDVEAGFGGVLGDRLRRFLVRTDAEVGPVVAARMVSLRGEGVVWPDGSDERSDSLLAEVSWPGFEGIDVLWRLAAGEEFVPGPETSSSTSAEVNQIEEKRVRAGVPRLGSEILPGSIPAESGRVAVDLSVSFTKGCYTGQELVARMRNRGAQAPKRLRCLTSAARMAVGAEVIADDVGVGVVTSAVGSFALARLIRRLGPGDQVSAAGVEAVVNAVPGDDLTEPT